MSVGVGRDTAVNVYQWLREVCTTKLLQTTIKLGGPEKIVQIDESLFRHKSKVLNLIDVFDQLIFFMLYSTIVGVLHNQKLGYLEWWIHPSNQLWDL